MKFTTAERLRYAFDNTLARGTVALIFWLAVVTAVAIGLFATILVITGFNQPNLPGLTFAEAAWGSLMRTLDSGTMGGDQGWGFRIIMLGVTLVGIFILSTLIGVLGSGLEAQIEELRKGRSRVVETDHTVILGWSEQVFPILAELIEANASRSKASIVILGMKDKVEMEDTIRDKIGDTKTTTIVCRTGSSIEIHDLSIASIDAARSIIVLAPEGEGGGENEDADIDVIKTILAVTNNPARKKGKYHLIAEIRDPKNIEVAEMVGKDEVELVLVGDLIARIMAQTCRQSGLSVVYTELLDFGGVEIYFKSEPALTGKTFAEILFSYDNSSVIGIRPQSGPPQLNPPMTTKLAAGDRLIVVAEDDDAIRLSAAVARPDKSQIVVRKPVAAVAERTLILGWNWRGASVVNELDNYVTPGSTVHVVASSGDAKESIARDCAGLKRSVLTFQEGDSSDRRTLDGLNVSSYDHIIVLCYAGEFSVAQADARTLITLLHLRDIVEKANTRIAIVSEMLDVNNRRLAEVTKADDFIVSDRLVSLMLSQISENKELNLVFKSLFSSEGSEIYLKPASLYINPGVPVTFATVVAAAAESGEVAFGYKLASAAGDASRGYGVVVNPPKSANITLGPDDRVIVLSEN